MPRTPYLDVVSQPRGAFIDVGLRSMGQRPILEALLAQCLMSWSHIEAEMALVLGQLLGAENAVALAVFRSIRQSQIQRNAIAEAAKVALNDTDQKLLAEILKVHKSIEAERNDLAHGHFGTSTKVLDGLLWMKPSSYIPIRALITLTDNPQWDDAKHQKLLSTISVYKADDLTKIRDDMKTLADIWYGFVSYLRTADGSQARADKYRELIALLAHQSPPAEK